MTFLEMAITSPSNNAVFDGLGSTITFAGSVVTGSTSSLYFGWFSTVTPWVTSTSPFATVMGEARVNASSQGASALNFSTNAPRGGSWGMGTQWIQFVCKNTSSETDFSTITMNGFDGGKSTMTLPSWTVNPRKVHILNANFIHPVSDSRYECDWGPSNRFLSPVEIYFEVRGVLDWISDGTSRNTHAVSDWPGDSEVDDELVFELHDGSIGTYGDAIFKSDANSSTWVLDLAENEFEEDDIPCLWWNWSTSVGSKTLYLLVYHDGNRVTSGAGSTSTSVSFTVVSSCPDPP